LSMMVSSHERKLRSPRHSHCARSRQACSSASCRMSSGARCFLSAALNRDSMMTRREPGPTDSIKPVQTDGESRSGRPSPGLDLPTDSDASTCYPPESTLKAAESPLSGSARDYVETRRPMAQFPLRRASDNTKRYRIEADFATKNPTRLPKQWAGLFVKRDERGGMRVTWASFRRGRMGHDSFFGTKAYCVW